MVVDKKTGKKVDVRQLLGQDGDHIKNESLKTTYVNAQPKLDPGDVVASDYQMIEYDTVESMLRQSMPQFDNMSDLDLKDNWDLWWEEKDKLNQKLAYAIAKNDLETVKLMFQPSAQTGNKADANFQIDDISFNKDPQKKLILSPLLLAV